MVLMKKAAKALAPSDVCWVASSGMTGGFSPRFVFGPVRGTSAGRVGWATRGGPGLTVVPEEDAIGGGSETVGVRAGEVGASPAEEVHAAAPANATNAANVQIQRIPA